MGAQCRERGSDPFGVVMSPRSQKLEDVFLGEEPQGRRLRRDVEVRSRVQPGHCATVFLREHIVACGAMTMLALRLTRDRQGVELRALLGESSFVGLAGFRQEQVPVTQVEKVERAKCELDESVISHARDSFAAVPPV